MRVGKVIGKYKMAKHFELDITDRVRLPPQGRCRRRSRPRWPVHRRTSVPATELDAEHTVRAYKGLSVVERAFRSLKTVDLKVRPIYHYAGARVRAHVFLCMLAYRMAHAPTAQTLFDDARRGCDGSLTSAQDKARRKRKRVHTVPCSTLATANNRVVAPLAGCTRPTALVQAARLGQ